MSISNRDRVGKALDLLQSGLIPFVEREMKRQFKEEWLAEAARGLMNDRSWGRERFEGELDVQALLGIMWNNWDNVFKRILGRAERSLVSEIRSIRNNWAHQQAFSTDDTYRALDSIERLLLSISAEQSGEIGKHKQEVLRAKYEEQVKAEQKKVAHAAIEGQPKTGLKAWREVITPHQDVASGRYQQAEFAVDLWQIHCGDGTAEYRDPKEFFRRTYLTQGLEQLLRRGIERLSGTGGDPVVELKTNFGGGKTHSMLALYHLCSGLTISELAGVDKVLKGIDTKKVPTKVSKAVLVGTKMSPGQPSKKPDGTIVHTMWGELAWQLGGKAGYEMVEKADRTATNPGDALRELFNQFSPCLILVDEWVAYARQLYQANDLPAGSFDTHFTFAQSLSECAKTAKNTFLVVSIPASDAEIGGEGGNAALERLNKAIGRVEATWNPATSDESFEIVRRRLFHEIVEPTHFTARDAVVKAFMEQYRQAKGEFPSECSESDYERRLKAAYPIHPSLFDALYDDWSTLDKFQRTRGVLRLMASVIHRLWEQGDGGLMVMPSNIPLENSMVQPELTRYLDDEQPWAPVISTDIDGPNSLSLAMDQENSNLGRYSACRRVARTIFMKTAPHSNAITRGVSDKEIRLGCIQPGEALGSFGDALRRLAAASTHLYEDAPHYWYSLKPNVNRLAKDRAANIEEYLVHDKLGQLLRERRIQGPHEFVKVYAMPSGPSDVPDELSARIVILGPTDTHTAKLDDSKAIMAASECLNQRGGGARVYRNTLLFLAADINRMKELDQAIRSLLAWDSIIKEADEGTLNLDTFQRKTAESKHKDASATVDGRIREAYTWLLVPEQRDDGSFSWDPIRLQGQDGIVTRASKRSIQDEHLLIAMAPARVVMELNKRFWGDTEHLSVKRVWECFCSYTYLPRLKDERVLLEAIENGVGQLLWVENFGYAEGFDEKTKRYLGLKGGSAIKATMASTSLLVKASVAQPQLRAEAKLEPREDLTALGVALNGGGSGFEKSKSPVRIMSNKPTRFSGTVKIDPARITRDVGKIAEEVIVHLTSQLGSEVEITLLIDAKVPKGVSDELVRTITENCKVLKFTDQGFEHESSG
jgi:predicted AAA+ superfamily ATPase